jgi:phospholipase C
LKHGAARADWRWPGTRSLEWPPSHSVLLRSAKSLAARHYFGALALAPGSPYHQPKHDGDHDRDDHASGCAKDDHASVDGLSCHLDISGNFVCSNSNVDENGKIVTVFHDPRRCVGPDLDHGWLSTHREANFDHPNDTLKNFLADGFVRVNDMTEQIDPPGVEDPTEDQTMNFYTQSEIPFYYDLAQKFAIDDRYFSSVLRPTFPNRAYLMPPPPSAIPPPATSPHPPAATNPSTEPSSIFSTKTISPGPIISRTHPRPPASTLQRTSCPWLSSSPRPRPERSPRSPSSIPTSDLAALP